MLCFIQTLSHRRTLPCGVCVNYVLLRGLCQAYVMLDNHTYATTCPPDICRADVDV